MQSCRCLDAEIRVVRTMRRACHMSTYSTRSRAALAVLAALGLSAGIAATPSAQDRPFYDQTDTYGEPRRSAPANRAPRRDDSYRPPQGYDGPPGGFGREAAPAPDQGYGNQRPYDSAQPYGAPPDRGYDAPAYGAPGNAPQGYGGPPAYGAPSYGSNSQQPPYRDTGPPPQRANDAYSPPNGQRQGGWGNEPPAGPAGQYGAGQSGGFGQPYTPPPEYDAPPPGRGQGYGQGYPDEGRQGYGEPPRRGGGTYSQNEVVDTGHRFFGSISQGLANAVEQVFKSQGRPNGYILGEDAGGAFLAGLRYGEGTLYTKDAGNHRVYWQGPSLGYDFGGEGSKTMVLVYNIRDPADIYTRFGGVQGAAYVIGGVGVQFQKHEHVTLAVIRSGVGLRLGANVGYLKYTRQPTWNPF